MKFLTTAGLAAAAIALAGVASAQGMNNHSAGSGIKLSAMLKGSAEVPGPGDSDGMGTFHARLNPGTGQLCYTLTSSHLSTLTMAHIHSGARGVAGPPVVTLMANAPKETCLAVDKDLAMKIKAMPGDYYVNIHTGDFPAGAIRGQLMK